MTHTLTERIGAAARTAALATAIAAVVPPAAAAQSAGPRWQAWFGCWTAAPALDPALAPIAASAPLVCVTPTDDANVVEVATVVAGKPTATQRIDAGGRETPVTAKGCAGTERARWSADERRVYLEADATCDGVRRRTSGILAITAQGEWLDVQGVRAGEGDGVRVNRYRDAGLPSALPAEISRALGERSMSSHGARLAAGARVGIAAVVEASKAATDGVVEAWLLERGQSFGITARELVSLADAGVPGRVTDALVAVSNQGTFAVAREGPGEWRDDDVSGRRIPVYVEPRGPWGWGHSPYDHHSPYGYGAYGYGGYSPVIVINRPGAATPSGKVVKGRGYTRDDAAAAEASSSPSAGRAASPSGSGSSTGRTGGSSTSGSKGEQRTAKPRP